MLEMPQMIQTWKEVYLHLPSGCSAGADLYSERARSWMEEVAKIKCLLRKWYLRGMEGVVGHISCTSMVYMRVCFTLRIVLCRTTCFHTIENMENNESFLQTSPSPLRVQAGHLFMLEWWLSTAGGGANDKA